MSDPSGKTCMVVDRGQFPYVAQRLARDFGKVWYYSPDERAMPVMREGIIGDGFEDIECIASFLDEDADVFVFPDIGFPAEQVYFEGMGKPVWGCKSASDVESSRALFLKTLKEAGLEVPPHTAIVGMSELKDYLRDKEDKWIKVSKWRGDWETLHFRNWAQDELELIYREVKLGPLKERLKFYVFDKLDIAVEDGVDTWCIDGQWPETVIRGMEAKDEFFIGTFAKFNELPEEMRHVNEAIAPILAGYRYRGAFSTEVCITKDKTPYFTDATCRFGSPPSQIQMEMIGNWGEIVWGGANGECVEPEILAQFGIQGVLEITADASEWATVELPDELKQWVKCSFCGGLDGKIIFPPAEGVLRAWLVGIGDSIEEAIDHFKENAELLPDGVKANTQGLATLLEEINTAEEMGMEFTNQEVPEAKT